MSDVLPTLQKYYGYTSFRPLQEEIIQHILDNKDTFVLMPTGGGKSLCYQLPSLVMNGTTVVISPLISLMKDQVDVLRQNGVRAAYLNSSLEQPEQFAIQQELADGQLSLIYVAPERLVQDSFLSILKTIPINFFAIDEAHCISQWGHDFRPEYRKLDIIRKYFPDKPVTALTATATPRVKEDIVAKLKLRDAKIFQASFNRPNLSYTVIPKQNPFDQVMEYVSKHPTDSGIIYCQSRATVETVAAHLKEAGISALPYHAGLSDEVRSRNQEQFIRDDAQIIVATIAFGMGIDKPNVRYVIHYNLPKTLEHYYQETGRAGRDGLASECLLLFNYADRFAHERFIREKEDIVEQNMAIQQLNTVIEFAQNTSCRRAQLLQYFGEETNITNCASCDNCTIVRETFIATEVTQKILSCIYHVKGKFGIAQIVNILTGSKAEKILDYNHHKLSTYGIVKDFSRDEIRLFIYELIHQGYIQQTQDMYGLLGLTEKSVPVLQNKEEVFLIKPPKIVKTSKSKKSKSDFTANPELFNTLRVLRKRLADEANLPPYIIFSDATLKDMSSKIPRTKSEFREIKGVGEMKLEKYADVFLNEINKYQERFKKN
jgi:ATP-dependent DNA helicase RecQ